MLHPARRFPRLFSILPAHPEQPHRPQRVIYRQGLHELAVVRVVEEQRAAGLAEVRDGAEVVDERGGLGRVDARPLGRLDGAHGYADDHTLVRVLELARQEARARLGPVQVDHLA
jgi:hypothetical protein